MLRLIVQSAKISPPLSPPPRPCVSVYFRGKSQGPQEATCVQCKLGPLVPYCVKDAVWPEDEMGIIWIFPIYHPYCYEFSLWLLCLPFFQWMALCNPMNCRPPSSSVHGILQARMLEWVTMPSHTYSVLGKNLRFTNVEVLCRAMDCSLLKMFLEKTNCSG